jgi:hypothetical protein
VAERHTTTRPRRRHQPLRPADRKRPPRCWCNEAAGHVGDGSDVSKTPQKRQQPDGPGIRAAHAPFRQNQNRLRYELRRPPSRFAPCRSRASARCRQRAPAAEAEGGTDSVGAVDRAARARLPGWKDGRRDGRTPAGEDGNDSAAAAGRAGDATRERREFKWGKCFRRGRYDARASGRGCPGDRRSGAGAEVTAGERARLPATGRSGAGAGATAASGRGCPRQGNQARAPVRRRASRRGCAGGPGAATARLRGRGGGPRLRGLQGRSGGEGAVGEGGRGAAAG